MGFLSNLFGGGGERPRPNPTPSVSPKKLDQAVFLSEKISDMIRDAFFDEELIPTGKDPAAFGNDPYMTGFVFGVARDSSKGMGVGIDERDSIVIATATAKLIFGSMTKSSDPKAAAMFDRGTVNGAKVARDMADPSTSDGFGLMQSLWGDYVLYKYASPSFRKSAEFRKIAKASWFD